MSQEDCTTGRKKYQQIGEKERYRIEGHLRAKLKAKEIAGLLGKDRRSVEREIARGTVEQLDSELRKSLVYCADAGQRVCVMRKKTKAEA